MEVLSAVGAMQSAEPGAVQASGPSQLICFAIGDDQYGVDVTAVREIREWTKSRQLPAQADYICGVLDLRGSVMPILDLRRRFGQGETTPTSLHIIIIVQIDDRPVGLLADRVLDIVTVDEQQLRPVPKAAQSAQSSFLSGLMSSEAGLIALIDLPNLLNDTTRAAA